MPIFTKEALSASVNGRPIKVGATSTPGTLIHTTSATAKDEIYLYAMNTSVSDVDLTIEFGGVASPDDLLKVEVKASSGLLLVVPGVHLTNSLLVRAFAATIDVITIVGWVNRIDPGTPPPLSLPAYLQGGKLSFATVATVTIGTSGARSLVVDSTDAFNIDWTGTLTADITASGAGGLDTGVEETTGPNTFYAVHVIGDTSGTNVPAAMLSLSGTAPTMPAGYDKFRRLGWIVNVDGDLYKFSQHGAGRTRRIIYDMSRSELEVLSTDTQTGFNTLSLSDIMPVTSNYVMLFVSFEIGTSGADGDAAELRPEGSSETNPPWQYRPTNGVSTVKGTWPTEWIPTNATQEIEHGVTQGGADQNQLTLSMMGYEDEL